MGRQSVAVFSRFLDESDDWRRVRLVEALAQVPGPRALEVLLRQARAERSHDRRVTAECLAHRAEPEATEALIRLIRDRNSKVKAAAQRALQAQGGRAEAAVKAALATCINRRHREPLRYALRGFELVHRVLSGEPVSEDLIHLANTSACGQEGMAASLQQRDDVGDVPALISLLKHPRNSVRWHCGRLLVALGDRSLKPLQVLLAEELPGASRSTAEDALAELKRRAEAD